MDSPDTLRIPQCTCGQQQLPGRYGEPVCWHCDRLTTLCDVCGAPVIAENIGQARWRYTCDACFTDTRFYKRRRDKARKAATEGKA